MADARTQARIADIGADRRLAAVARELFHEYQRELGVDLCFQDFDAEVASLPGPYSPPAGCLLLATLHGDVAGCVGLRRFDRETAELKRLYVRAAARGHGIARELTLAALAHAGAQRYRRVVLDTLPSMAAAQVLYGSLGFCDVEPYRHNPIAGTRFLALDLTD